MFKSKFRYIYQALTLVISRYIDSYEKNDNKSLEIIEKEEQESKT